MGIIITYSSYVSKQENLIASGIGTAVADLMFAILAGFAVMPAVFSAGIHPSAGPGLIFQTLPYVFAQMGVTSPWLSSIVAVLFFLTVIVAAMTSSISLIEVGVAYLVEERRMKRGWACLAVFALTWLLGVFSALSIGFFGKVDSFSSNILLTAGAFLLILFVGWKMKREEVRDEITNGGMKNARIFNFIYFVIRYLAPVAVLVIFVTNFVL